MRYTDTEIKTMIAAEYERDIRRHAGADCISDLIPAEITLVSVVVVIACLSAPFFLW